MIINEVRVMDDCFHNQMVNQETMRYLKYERKTMATIRYHAQDSFLRWKRIDWFLEPTFHRLPTNGNKKAFSIEEDFYKITCKTISQIIHANSKQYFTQKTNYVAPPSLANLNTFHQIINFHISKHYVYEQVIWKTLHHEKNISQAKRFNWGS